MTTIAVAANRGDVGGGELMQLRLTTALRDLGHDVRVVAPASPGDLVDAATREGLDVEVVGGGTRAAYARSLRRWATRSRPHDCLLWCHGLLPAAATAGLPRRIVHLHQLPLGRQARIAAMSRIRTYATVVPSHFLARAVYGAHVLPNWTDELDVLATRPRGGDDPVAIGVLGRVGREKGTDVLADACRLLAEDQRGDQRRGLRLVVAGDDRFVPPADRTVVDAALSEAARAGIVVERPGWVDPSQFLAGVDVVVVPSVRPESFGLVAAEAMASGRPVVVSDAGALPEVVGAKHPWVAASGDARSLADVLGRAIAALPAADVVEAQRRRWEAEYSPAAGRRHLEPLMDRLT